jgi:hypothetical protein
MKKKLRVLLFSLALLFGLFFSYVLYLSSHKECRPKDFKYSSYFGPSEIVSISLDQIQSISSILDQKFYYLDRGKQMYAFESEDHEYVIKFFSPRQFIREETFSEWKRLKRILSLKWFSNAFIHKNKRLSNLANIYYLAFEHLRDLSGIVYLHVNSSTVIDKKLYVVDQFAKTTVMDLRYCPFVLQKKATLATKHFNQLLKDGQIDDLISSIESLSDLFIVRAKKGFTDRIQALHNNYGFVGNRAVQIDLGRVYFDASIAAQPQKEVERIFSQLQSSIAEHHPELDICTRGILQKKLEALFLNNLK